MPAISFFADRRDINVLLDQLNTDPEIAFIVPDGPLAPEMALAKRLRSSMGDRDEATFYSPFGIVDDGYRQRWKAVRSVEQLKDGSHSLWHVPAGSLPLLTEDGTESPIPDPWAGWTEQRTGADPTKPYFGPGHPAEIRLDLWTRHRPYSDEERNSLPVLNSNWDGVQDFLAVSDFQWIGGHYGPPPAQTRRWWNRLKAWFGRSAIRLADGRTGLTTFWAFPSALQRLKAGVAYYARGFALDESIRTAELELSSPKLRDLVPPRPLSFEAYWLKWNGGLVVQLAQAIHKDRAFDRLPILADALEEAGCDDADILNHCRGQGPHVRGCWVIDMILNRP